MSHSQFHSIDSFILRHAWLNLWDKRMLLAESTRLLSLSCWHISFTSGALTVKGIIFVSCTFFLHWRHQRSRVFANEIRSRLGYNIAELGDIQSWFRLLFIGERCFRQEVRTWLVTTSYLMLSCLGFSLTWVTHPLTCAVKSSLVTATLCATRWTSWIIRRPLWRNVIGKVGVMILIRHRFQKDSKQWWTGSSGALVS